MVIRAGSAVSKTLVGWVIHCSVKTITQKDTHNAIFCTGNKENSYLDVVITRSSRWTI